MRACVDAFACVKEAFINALSDGNLQLEVMKREPLNIEAALSHAIKVEGYEQSLACQGTLVTDQDEGRAKRRSRNVNRIQVKLSHSRGVWMSCKRRLNRRQRA